MTRYNSTQDTDLLKIISQLRSRIDKLERRTTTTTVPTASVPATSYATFVAVTSTTFVDTHIFPGIFLAPTAVARLVAYCSDSSTAGEFQLTDLNGSPLTDKDGNGVPPTPIPLGTVAQTDLENNQDLNYWDNFPVGTERILKLQVRRTTGAGTINIKAKYLLQIPS